MANLIGIYLKFSVYANAWMENWIDGFGILFCGPDYVEILILLYYYII